MPLITFYWALDDNCEVRTGEGKDDATNQRCIEAIVKYLSTAAGSHKTRLVYIIHGWYTYFGRQEKNWPIEMKDSFLKRYEKEHIVVGVVSWDRAARPWPNEKNNNSKSMEKFSQAISNENNPPKLNGNWKKNLCCTFREETYLNAASNAWPIGNIIGYVDKEISNKYGAPNEIKTFCVGFGLGGHVCGFFGKMVKRLSGKQGGRIKKIIALDPSGPMFEQPGQDPSLRLNKDDADMVEVFHTNSYSLGFISPIGHRDFYINGGGRQPWCVPLNDFFVSRWFPEIIPSTCSHTFAYELMISLNKQHHSCHAEWRCDIVDGYFLGDITELKRHKLKGVDCRNNTSQRISLGTLLDDENYKGVHWVQIGNDSKTCAYDVSGN